MDDCIEQDYAKLQAEVLELRRDKEHAENMLAYERNKFKQLMACKESGIASEIMDGIRLELDGLRDCAQSLHDDDSRRVLRRVRRIEEFLRDFCDTV